MKPHPIHRLPAPLETAVQRLKMAAREAADRTIESLGLAALASSNAYHRDGLLGAQFELNRKSAVFVLTFNDALDERVLRELGPRAAAAGKPVPAGPPATDWAALSLVEDQEVEAQISAERFGMEIAHACEWELRELDGYVSALLGDAGGEAFKTGERNPLRPDLVGHAMIRGITAVCDRADVRKVLSTELSRSLGALLRHTYAEIMVELRNAGVQPLGLAARNRALRGGGPNGRDSGPDSLRDNLPGAGPASGHGPSGHHHTHPGSGYGGGDSRYAGRRGADGGLSGFAGSARGGFDHGPHSSGRGTPLGQVDPALMSLIRRLTFAGGGAAGGAAGGYGWGDDSGAGPLPANLIRAHRDELREASKGALDHMVIDVIGFLFDQILADPKVPPQMARQIARLQLPVLRAALGDSTFFSSRKHPVRRFINRIASLGSAFEDFGEAGAQALLEKVRVLIHEVVDGDFEHIDIYEQKLAALEAYAAEAAATDTPGQHEAAALLSEKEDQQRLRQLYAQRLEGDLKDVAAPPFLREFLSRTWSQVLLRAADQGGADGTLAQRLRQVGSALFLSVQAKATPGHRKAFLTELPKLMQDLTAGMNLIAWPEAQRRAFFGLLMPAHADALKSPAGRQLDINLMARQVEGALQRPLPSRAELKAAPPLPVSAEEAAAAPPPQFSAEEAAQVGLLPESAVDWDGSVDIDLGLDLDPRPGHGQAAAVQTPAERAAQRAAHHAAEARPLGPGLPAATDSAEPTEGRDLARHLEIGFAYQMNLEGAWHKVRLSHVSAARSFYIFSHGAKHKRTVSLTQRMLLRLCETGRLKAFESAYLMDRAAARARRQLASLGQPQPA